MALLKALSASCQSLEAAARKPNVESNCALFSSCFNQLSNSFFCLGQLQLFK